MAALPTISIAIPTYRREQVLVDTIGFLLEGPQQAAEILVVDQSETHEAATERALRSLHDDGRIRWLRLSEPSIPKAMNAALLQARGDAVLFLDDDIRPEPGLVLAHAQAQQRGESLVAGRVLQPWHEGRTFGEGEAFQFAGITPQPVTEFMGGNFSVRRDAAVAIGGFDENFVRVAYRFEAEFAQRWRSGGQRIWFEPAACIHHLKAGSGGTRSFGEHLDTWRPDHAVGAYYFALRSGTLRDFLVRPLRAVATRHHLRKPWRIPATLVAEVRGMVWALRLHRHGPARIASGGTA